MYVDSQAVASNIVLQAVVHWEGRLLYEIFVLSKKEKVVMLKPGEPQNKKGRGRGNNVESQFLCLKIQLWVLQDGLVEA